MQVDERVMTAVFVSVEEFVRIRTEQQDKHGRAKDSDGTLGGAGDVTGQIDQ